MSCPWTTPHLVPTSSHELTSWSVPTAPRRGSADLDNARHIEETGHLQRRDTSISCFCKYACTLFWGARISGRNLGGTLIGALTMSVATALILATVLSSSASALASGTNVKPRFCAYATLVPNSSNVAIIDAATLCLIDQVRATYGLLPLHSNHELQAVATTQVKDMVHWNYFADNRPPDETPATLIEATRYGAHASTLATGQNIAWGTGAYATPAHVVTDWMHSPPHREIILTADFRDAGVSATAAVPSAVEDRVPGATYAVEFGARG
jgi:uncharacterized protein YkwD